MNLSTKKHIKWRNLTILIVVVVLVVSLCFKLASLLFNNPYAAYQEYDEYSKHYGSLEHETMELDEKNAYLSVYYPEFDEEELNKLVESYKKDYVKENQNFDKMTYIMVDYDVDKIYDQYVSLTFHQTMMNDEDKVLKKESVSYNYDLKNKKQLHVKDVIRRDYIAKLKSLAKANNLDESLIRNDNLDSFIIGEKDLTFYFDNQVSKNIKLSYKDNKAYVALKNKNIPSYFQKDPVKPKPQPKVDKNKQVIAFTFDDGPKDKNTIAIMNELEKYNGRGTFFMLGQNVVQYPEVVQEMYKRGHELANHSWDHSQDIAFTGRMNAQQVTAEVYDTNDEIYKLTGYEPQYMRPPYGEINNTLESVCGLDFVKWDIDSKDWESHNPDSIAKIIEESAEVGYRMILLHDIHDESVEGTKKALKILHDKGYQFVTVSTLLEQEKEYYVDRENLVYIPTIVGADK